MSLLGELAVAVVGDVGHVKKAFGEVESAAGKLGRELGGKAKDSTDRLNASLTMIGITAAAGAAAVFMMAVKTAQAADRIDKMSERTGISRSRLQELQYACGQTGVSMDSVQTAVTRMVMAMSQGDEEGQAMAEAFERLGVATRDANGDMRSADVVFQETLLALAAMDNQTERNALALRIFGRGAMELVPLLNQGEKGIAALTARAHELGLVMSDEAIASNVEFADMLDEVKRSFGAMAAELGTMVLPLLKAFLDVVGEIIGIVRSLLKVLGSEWEANTRRRVEADKAAALEEIVIEEKAMKARIAASSAATRARLDNLDQEKDAVRKSLESQRRDLDEAHNDAISKIREEYGVAEVVTNSKTDLARRASQARMDALDAEADKVRQTYDVEISKINEVLAERLGLIDSEAAAEVKRLQGEINAVQHAQESEDRAAQRRRDKKETEDLKAEIAAETNAERRVDLEERLADKENEIRVRSKREAAQHRVEDLRDQINKVREGAQTARDILETQAKNDRATAETTRDAGLADITTLQTAEKNALIETIQGIQLERLEVEAAENAKYVAAKTSLDNRLAGLDAYYVKVKAQLKLDVIAFEAAQTEQEAILAKSLAARRKLKEDYFADLLDFAKQEKLLEEEAIKALLGAGAGGAKGGAEPKVSFNIPEFQGGGVFDAPVPGGAGLAILHDQERVSGPGGPFSQYISQSNIFYGVDRPVAEAVTNTIVRRLRQLGGQSK